MMIPSIDPVYINERHPQIKMMMESSYTQSITIMQAFWGAADTANRYEVGDQGLYNDYYGNVPASRKRNFTFNKIRPITNLITGQQRLGRKSIIVVPVENADNKTADQFSKVVMWAVNKENILETISEAFHGAVVTGMNLLYVWVDYRNDPVCGDIKVDNCAYNTFIIDPYFRKKDLSDCNFIWRRSYISKRECISLMPEKAEEILSLNTTGTSSGRDGKFQFMPEQYSYNMQNLVSYDEYYYRDFRTQKMLVDMQTGESIEWKSEDDEKLQLFLMEYPQIQVIEQDIPTVRLAISIEGKVFYDGPNPNGTDLYPFVPVLAYYNPQLPYFVDRVQGVVKGLQDAQMLYNRRKVIELDILESTLNSGWIYKENALVNPADVFMTGQGKGLAIHADAAMTDVQQIQSPIIPPTTIQISEILGKELNTISGINEEMTGMAIDDKAAVLSMLRQKAGQVGLQGLFDNLDFAQKILGTIMIKIIQSNFTPGKIKKILEGQEPEPQFYNKAFGIYNADVEDGLNTATQKQMQFAQMLQLREMGLPISPEDLLEAATLQNKDRIIENLQKAEQQQAEMQQHQMQMQMELQAAQIELARARAKADIGLFAERTSRVEENRALAIEKIHEAHREDETALLEKVKALKELDDMDLGHLERLVNVSNILKSQEQQDIETDIKPEMKRTV